MNKQNTQIWIWAFSGFLLVGALGFPVAVQAAVSISEIMYNPAGSEAGREWVELYNSGQEDVALVGGSGKGSWRLVDSSNHTLTDPEGGVGRGSLLVPAGGYVIISSDPSAFMSEYSGTYSVIKSSLSLNNSGATVSLIDGAGATVSSFAYTSSMGGADNGTSLQDGGSGEWVSALPTPGALNATQSYTPPAAEGGTNAPSTNKTTANPGYVTPPLPQIFADAGEDRTVIVGADAKFVASAYDRDRDVINYAKFLWNFGDGTTAEGPWVMHHFSYPGRYAVELIIKNDARVSSSRITVMAEPAAVKLDILEGGGVSLRNYSGRDLDVSFWKVAEADSEFSLPEHSVVLKDSSINIAPATLGFGATLQAQLRYPDGSQVLEPAVPAPTASEPAPKAAAAQEPEPVVAASTPEAAQVVPEVLANESASSTEATSTPTEAPVDTAILAASVAQSAATFPLWASATGLGGVIGIGVISVWYARGRRTGEETPMLAEEFTIE